jgi:hypothetical protein
MMFCRLSFNPSQFEKLKLSSRNKREAKVTTPPPLAVVGEEEGGEG